MAACPVAVYLLGKTAAIFTYVIPFLVSTVGGTLIAAVIIAVMDRSHALRYLHGVLEG